MSGIRVGCEGQVSAQLKEALRYVATAGFYGFNSAEQRAIVISVLTEALRESAAWSDITEFQRTHSNEYDLIVGLADEESEADGEYLVRLVDVSDGSEERFPGASRVECLEAAAGFCRGEMAK